MKLIEIIIKAQSSTGKKRTAYCKKLYDIFREFITKQFIVYSPYTENEKTCKFVTGLALEFFEIINNKINNFKLKKQYGREELEEHVWCYFQTVTESVIDRALIRISIDAENESLRNTAGDTVKKKYKGLVEDLISENVRNTETSATKQLNAWELEEYWGEETRRLVSQFYKQKFTKITSYFEKDNSTAIFRNYVKKAIKNFLIDYRRGENVKKMRRVYLYRENLPEALFEILKVKRGHGNLFYYKKKQDCLSIRDIGKALSVIRDLNLPEWQLRDLDRILIKNRKRAEYQRTIDNISSCISEKCRSKECRNRLTSKIIKILINTGDVVMKNRLSITDDEITMAGERLKKCVTCLDIDRSKIN